MPAYSFMQRFSPFVIDGSKPHTIRNRRKHPAKPGDTLYLYEAMRTKWCKKLREETCTAVKTIIICEPLTPDTKETGHILLYDRRLEDHEFKVTEEDKLELDSSTGQYKMLSTLEKNQLAWIDGIRPDGTSLNNPAGCFEVFFRFFKKMHPLPFIGDIIYWDPKKAEEKLEGTSFNSKVVNSSFSSRHTLETTYY